MALRSRRLDAVNAGRVTAARGRRRHGRRFDLDDREQSTRVRDDMGSRCGLGAGFVVVVKSGKWHEPGQGSQGTGFLTALGPQHRDPGRFYAQDPETLERAVSRQIPVRSTSLVRSSGRPLFMAVAPKMSSRWRHQRRRSHVRVDQEALI